MSRSLRREGALPASVAGHEGTESADAQGPSPSDGAARRSLRDGWIPWILLAVVLAVALVVGTGDDGQPPTEAERIYQLARQVKCPQCAGQSVAESDVVISREIRRDIASRVEAGETDEQILQAYADRYGQEILLEPPTSGSSRVVWLLPVVALVGGLVIVVVVFRRWRTSEVGSASAEDEALVAEALAGSGAVEPDRAGAGRDEPHVEPGDR